MNAWITRGLHTAVLTGGFLAVGAGIASADQNDVVADVAGLTVTVPVDDSVVVDTPVVTGGGDNLTVTGNPSASGLSLPVDTSTGGNTTVDLGGPAGDSGGIDAVSVPVTVSEAQDGPPDPDDGLTVTVPVNTSDGDEDAGTAVIVPVVTGNLGHVLDDDPTSGNRVDVDLAEPLVGRDAADGTGSQVHVDVEDLVTIGGTGSGTSPETVLAVPVSAEDGADTTVSLANGDGTASPGLPGAGADPLSGNHLEVTVCLLVAHCAGSGGDGTPGASNPVLSVVVDAGTLTGGTGSGNGGNGGTGNGGTGGTGNSGTVGTGNNGTGGTGDSGTGDAGATGGTAGFLTAGRTVHAASGQASAALSGSLEGAAPGALAHTGPAALLRVLLLGMLIAAGGLLLLLVSAGRRRRPLVA